MRPAIWWLASYPKSGNTWLRSVLVTLTSKGSLDINDMASLGPMASLRAAFDDTLGVDSADLPYEHQANLRPRVYEIWAAEAERPLYCKVHDACHLTPSGEPLFPPAATRGAIYVARDPRAVAVSYSHHSGRALDATIARMDSDATIDESPRGLSRVLRQRPMRWSDHVESWLAAPFPIHLVRYEDMLADPHAKFAGIAAFLGLACDRAAIDAAVEATAFSRLREKERSAGFTEKPWGAAAFFREGRSDGWRRVLTPEQADRIVAAHGPMMQRLGYDVTSKPLVAEARDLAAAR
jgi:aryl sulfotransferase